MFTFDWGSVSVESDEGSSVLTEGLIENPVH